MRWLLLCYSLQLLKVLWAIRCRRHDAAQHFEPKNLKEQLEMEHASHLLSSLWNLPLIFTAILLFQWSCTKWNYSFLILFGYFLRICEQVFGFSWITYALFRNLSIPLMVPVGQSANQLPALPAQHLGHIWGSQGSPTSSQPKGSPWQEPSMSTGACPGEAVLGFNEGRTGQSQHNLPAVCNWCCTFFNWVSESYNLRWRKWQCLHQGRSLEYDMPPVWVALSQNPASRATAAFTSPQFSSGSHRQCKAQVTTAGNASCPTGTRPAASDTTTLITPIASSRAAAEIMGGSHGLGLKHHLITPTNCSLTLCLTLTSQRELPAQHLLSQRTRCQARSSHLLINCSSWCCSPNEGLLRSLPAPGSLPLPGIHHQAWTQSASRLSWLLEPEFGPFLLKTMHEGNLACAERTGTKPEKSF